MERPKKRTGKRRRGHVQDEQSRTNLLLGRNSENSSVHTEDITTQAQNSRKKNIYLRGARAKRVVILSENSASGTA